MRPGGEGLEHAFHIIVNGEDEKQQGGKFLAQAANQFDAADFGHAQIHEHKVILSPIIAEHDGILIKVEADSLIIIFRRTASALRCAVKMQRALALVNAGRPPETEVLLCVGIGHGDILRIGDIDIFGREVNAASKLGEDTAKAREVLLTKCAVDSVAPGDGFKFERIDVSVAGSSENYRLIYD